MTTILNKSSTYAEFAELFVKCTPKVYRTVDIMADWYKTESIKSSEQLSIRRSQSEKIHIASLLWKVPSDFHNSILRNSDTKKKLVFELIFEYIEREAKHFLELLGSSEIILASKNKCILVTATWIFTSLIISRRTWYKGYYIRSWNIKRKFLRSIHPFCLWWYWRFTWYSSSSVRIWKKSLHDP